MIEYFTALVLSYTLHNHEINTVVWFESEQHCMKAMSSRTFDHFYDHMYELYGNDISMWCLPSDVQSKLVRPRVRPN
tara:strand:- start:447 stop:677 length:231 start_codon:yes stop_codon:yes gene_type:complete